MPDTPRNAEKTGWRGFADELLGVDIQRGSTHTGLNGLAQAAQHFVEKRARVTHLPICSGFFKLIMMS